MAMRQSSRGSASSRFWESGTEIAGLAAMLMRALIWPFPGVAISSARHEHGTWPRISGAPRTRLRHRPNSGSPMIFVSGIHVIGTAAGFPNNMPPDLSNCPAMMLTTSTSHDASVPNSWLHKPILSSFVAWVVRDDRGICEPGSVVRESLMRAADILHKGNPEQRRHAINFLDKLSKDTAGRDPLTSGASLDSLLSFGLQTDIGPLKNVTFESVAPATTEQVLELLGGIQTVQLRLKTSFKSRSRTGFDRVLFGIYPDESLFAQARNPIGGQLRGRISTATCEQLGGYEQVIRRIANDLSRSESTTNVRTSLQTSLEGFVNLDPDVNTIVSPFDSFGSKVPPANNAAANAAYEIAGRLGDVWAHATGGDMSEMRVEWVEGTDTCKATVGEIGPENSSIQATINEKGITKLVVHVGYDESPRKVRRLVVDTEKEGRSPLAKPEAIMTKIFRFTEELSDRAPLSWKDVEHSKLFEYLQTL